MAVEERKSGLYRDVFFIVLSIVLTVAFARTGLLSGFFTLVEPAGIWSSLFAGFFFTSVFTIAPAIASLGTIAQIHPIISMALLGAIGATIGDLIIFHFIRDRFAEHLLYVLQHRRKTKRLAALFKTRLARVLSFFIGGLIIASPLPDELGLSLMAFSRMSPFWFVPMSFFFNFVGIVIIGTVARTV